MSSPNYAALFSEALADVDTGVRHPCGTTADCRAMGGCPRCYQGVMRGRVDVARVDVFTKAGLVRLTMDTGCGRAEPCVVSFKVPLTIHGKGE
jgi:hypothetical protein